MAYTTINKSTAHFNTKIYSGTGNDNLALTGVGFQPDLTWIKERSSTSSHALWDAVRGATKKVESDNNQVEGTDATGLKSFDSDGFTVGTSAQVNQSGVNNVAWNWKAGGAASNNTDGSVTSSVSVNTTAGFSISKYTGTGSNLTFGHGLGAIPDWFMIKNLTVDQAWRVYHQKVTASDPYSKRLVLSENGADSSSALGLSQDPSSSLIYIDNSTGCTNANNENFICYAWVEKTGFSKFGSYTGNGSTDGTFVYTGFKPAWVMTKVQNAADNWSIWDNKREPTNVNNNILRADTSAAETPNAAYAIDFLSNGFKFRGNDTKINGNGSPYIYMAFGQSLVGSNNVPATAR